MFNRKCCREGDQDTRPSNARKDSNITEGVCSDRRSQSSTKNNTANPQKAKSQLQWPVQTSQFGNPGHMLNCSMFMNRFEGPGSYKANVESTKVNDKASESRASEVDIKNRHSALFSANSNKIGASIMRNRRELDLSVTPSAQSSKQEPEKKANNQNAVKLMSTPGKNVNGFSLANPAGAGLACLGTANAPNSNIKSQLKVPIASYDNRKMLFGSALGKDVSGSDIKEFMRSCDSKKSMTMGQRFLHFDQSSNRDDHEVPNGRMADNNLPKSFADLCAGTNILGMPGSDKPKQNFASHPFRPRMPQMTISMPQFYNNFFGPSTFVHHQHHHQHPVAAFGPGPAMPPHSKTCSRNINFEQMKQDSASSSDDTMKMEIISNKGQKFHDFK